MNVYNVIAELQAEKRRIDCAIAALELLLESDDHHASDIRRRLPRVARALAAGKGASAQPGESDSGQGSNL
ncbi:MAG: hypothetical protein U0Q18_24965 [Bryobacteraceae bacterium]